jgi:Tfp pilus assembly protein PilN
MTDKLRKLASRIDFSRLSGVRSVLGIALEPGGAHVVELKRRGNLLDSISGKIQAVKWFVCNFDGKTIEESGNLLKNALVDYGIHTAYAVISVKGARFVSAVIPPEVDNTPEWIEENTARLLHLPVAPSEIVSQIDIVGSDPSGKRALVTFLRKGEIENCTTLAGIAGIHLLSISPSFQDLMPVCALSQTDKLPSSYQIAHYDQSTLTTITCEEGRVSHITTEHTKSELSLAEVLERSSSGQGGTDAKVFVSGAFEKSESDHVLIRPFGLTSDYALASGLAVRGLLPKRGSVGFLPQTDQIELSLNLTKSLFRRTLLASGLTLLVLLAIPLAASSYLAMKSDQLDQQIGGRDGSVAEIEGMEKEVSALQKSSKEFALPGNRSNSSFILHEIAKLTPKRTRLLSLVLVSDDPSIDLKGEAESERDISELMKDLKNSPLCRDLSLKKLETGGARGGNTTPRKGRVYFELSLKLVKGRGI